jgi:hypothetical protein
MYFRLKVSGGHTYLQLVTIERVTGEKKPRQTLVASFGRLDKLLETGKLDSLIESLQGVKDRFLENRTKPAD